MRKARSATPGSQVAWPAVHSCRGDVEAVALAGQLGGEQGEQGLFAERSVLLGLGRGLAGIGILHRRGAVRREGPGSGSRRKQEEAVSNARDLFIKESCGPWRGCIMTQAAGAIPPRHAGLPNGSICRASCPASGDVGQLPVFRTCLATLHGLLALGINHKTASVDVRERVAFHPEQLVEALQQLCRLTPSREAAILHLQPQRGCTWSRMAVRRRSAALAGRLPPPQSR